MVNPTDKRYNNDPAKSRSRDLVRGMLERTLLKERAASEVKVVCFPGIDAQEVLDVYDPLGIPRANIVGLEIDPEIAARIQAKGLGIEVIRESAEDYFAKHSRHDYDVVSLDFTGTINKRTRKLIRDIIGKQKKTRFALHLAHSMRRDGYFSTLLDEMNKGEGHLPGFINSQINNVSSGTKLDVGIFGSPSTLPEDEMKSIRAFHYSTFIRGSLYNPDILSRNIGSFLFGRENYENLLNKLVDEFKISDEDLFVDGGVDAEKIGRMHGFISRLNRTICNKIYAKLSGRIKIPPQNSHMFYALLQFVSQSQTGHNFYPGAIEKYSYISESGTPMNGDILFLEKNIQIEEAQNNLAKAMGYPRRFEIKRYKDFQRAHESLKLIDSEMLDFPLVAFTNYRKAERTYLGNSRTMQREGEGLVGKVNSSELEESQMSEARDQVIALGERITKEEAYDLLASDIPIKEIMSAYPGSFSEGQLRAYKAWITMRANEEEVETNV